VPGVDAPHQRLSLARQAAIPFLDMLQFFNPADRFRIARFPRQPFQGCFGERSNPNGAGALRHHRRRDRNHHPRPGGRRQHTLLAGSARGRHVRREDRKALVLLSDGFHNCPPDSGLDDLGQAMDELAANAIRTYAIGFGQPGEVPNDILGQLAAQTQGGYYDVTTTSGFDPLAWDPANGSAGGLQVDPGGCPCSWTQPPTRPA